jgi:hypothetical protein
MICTRCKVNEAHEYKTSKTWCKGCHSQYGKEYRSSRKKHLKECTKKWVANNLERHRIAKNQYRHSPLGKCLDMIKSAKRRADRRSLDFSLDTKFLLNLWKIQKSSCALTSIPFVLDPEKRAHPLSPSIDRSDPSKGYTTDNVRLVCYGINCCLHNFGEEVFNALAEYRIRGGVGVVVPYVQVTQGELTPKQILDRKYRGNFAGTITALLHNAVKHSKERNLAITIDKDYVRNLLQTHKTCAVTNIPFDFSTNHYRTANPFRPSLDRINSNKGYEPDNVRLVCVAVNYALNEFGDNVFHSLCEKYLEKKSFIET